MKNDILNYERPSITVDVVLLRIKQKGEYFRKSCPKELQICLYKRKTDPFCNKWSLPGGFVSIDKTLENVLIEKLKEKTGYSNCYFEQLYTFDKVDRDNRWRVISTSYIGIVKENEEPQYNSEYTTKWFYLQDNQLVSDDGDEIIDYNNLAFDHKEIIEKAIERIQNKIFYSDIAFKFIDEYFTVKTLQDVFETILGKQVINFRRTIGKKIVETNRVVNGQAHRPATIYKKRELP